MPLEYIEPVASLARELREVARDAAALEGTITRGINFSLPTDFPRTQLIDICRSLKQLPEGTAEGCRASLEYSRNRLPAIRRAHVLSEEANNINDKPDMHPQVLRGALIDQRLRDLIASVTTALDEYRRLASDEPLEETALDAGVSTPSGITAKAVAESMKIESRLIELHVTLDDAANPNSLQAQNLKRQVTDATGLNRLARAEVAMPKLIVSWYRQIIGALKDYPTLIRKTAAGLKVGADLFEIGIDRWHDFERNFSMFCVKEFKELCNSFDAIADRLDTARANGAKRDHEQEEATEKTDGGTPLIQELDSQSVASDLPDLKRYADALVGEEMGDACIEATLETLIENREAIGSSKRIALFRLFAITANSISANSLLRNPAVERRILERIPMRQREAYLLHSIHEFSEEHAAEILSISLLSFRTLYSQATKTISQNISTNVLIIEDETFAGLDLEALVEGLGHRVIGVARTYTEALALAKNRNPGLILADIQLADGSSGLNAVNDILKTLSMPVIFITAYPERFLTGNRPEPAFLIAKPFLPGTVARVITQSLVFARRARIREERKAK